MNKERKDIVFQELLLNIEDILQLQGQELNCSIKTSFAMRKWQMVHLNYSSEVTQL